MHRIEEGLHQHSFGNVKTVLCTVLQFKVESDRHSICARSPPAFPGCLPLASVWPWGHYRPIYLLLPSLSTTVQVRSRDCNRLLVVVPCVNRRAPTNHSRLSQECQKEEEQGWTRRRDTALVPSGRGASKIVKAVYTKGRREKKRSTVRTAQGGLMAIWGCLLPSGQSCPHLLSPSLPYSPVSVSVGSPLAEMSG